MIPVKQVLVTAAVVYCAAATIVGHLAILGVVIDKAFDGASWLKNKIKKPKGVIIIDNERKSA